MCKVGIKVGHKQHYPVRVHLEVQYFSLPPPPTDEEKLRVIVRKLAEITRFSGAA